MIGCHILYIIPYTSISCDVTRHSGRHICAPQIRGQIHTKTVSNVILLAIIMDSGENRADKSNFTNQHHSTPLSGYAKNLDGAVKQRYLEKIECIGIDPILLEGKKFDPDCLPPVESADLLTYLVLETSYYTKDQFKNFRSLEAFNLLVSGFVTSVQGHRISDKFVVLAKVRHSQRMNDTLLTVWVISEENGVSVGAHCLGCKAGLAESCSHIACALLYLESWTKIHGNLPVHK